MSSLGMQCFWASNCTLHNYVWSSTARIRCNELFESSTPDRFLLVIVITACKFWTFGDPFSPLRISSVLLPTARIFFDYISFKPVQQASFNRIGKIEIDVKLDANRPPWCELVRFLTPILDHKKASILPTVIRHAEETGWRMRREIIVASKFSLLFSF